MDQLKSGFILTVNCGSPSLKFSLYEGVHLGLLWEGAVKDMGTSSSKFPVKNSAGVVLTNHSKPYGKIDDAIPEIIDWLKSNSVSYPVMAIGYRVILGGQHHYAPELITTTLLDSLAQQTCLAPNHLPDELNAIRAFMAAFKNAAHVACFDTFFHKDMPAVARFYPLPADYANDGLIRCGFHGLSCEYLMQQLSSQDPALKQRAIITGGIGENSALIRKRICRDLKFLGINIDQQLNNTGAAIVSSPLSNVQVRVIPTNEAWIIARHTKDIIEKFNN